MSLFSWLVNRTTSDSTGHRRAHGTPPKPATFRPRLEALEDRWLPSTLTVTNTNDSGAGSLRAAIGNAHQQGDTIDFAPSLAGQTITLTSGELLLNKNLTIAGPGDGQLTVSGGGLSRVFEVAKKKNVALSGLTIGTSQILYGYPATGGGVYNHGTLTITNCTLESNVADFGGGIFNELDATLTVRGSTLSGNTAGDGGGIYNRGTLTITNCTLSGNGANFGGAIYNDASATAAVSGRTLVSNTAEDQVRIIYNNQSGTLTVSDSAFSGNGPYAFGYIDGPYIDGGGNTFN
jgi:hypothetical protein